MRLALLRPAHLTLLAILRTTQACMSVAKTFEERPGPGYGGGNVAEYKLTDNEQSPACELTEWSSWSACSATCGTGTEVGLRSIALVDGAWVRPDCLSQPLLRTRICAFKACEETTTCSFSEWLAWSPCSAVCGLGEQSRVRSTFDTRGPCNEVTRQSQLCFQRLCQFLDETGERLAHRCTEALDRWNSGATVAHVPGGPNDCCDICGASQLCSAWSWQVDTCFLKAEAGTNREWPRAISGDLLTA